MNNKLQKLCNAMIEYEGWDPIITTKNGRGSRSYRNHNPGNLRASPFSISQDDGFAVFDSDWDGLAAMKWDIIQKAKGNTKTNLGPNSTIRELIYTWAPESDRNNPQRYLEFVLTKTNFSENMKLSELLPQ